MVRIRLLIIRPSTTYRVEIHSETENIQSFRLAIGAWDSESALYETMDKAVFPVVGCKLSLGQVGVECFGPHDTATEPADPLMSPSTSISTAGRFLADIVRTTGID